MVTWMLYGMSSVHSICAHWDFGKLPFTEIRGVSRTTARSEMEIFVTKVSGWKPLTFFAKSSMSDFAVVLDMPPEVDAFNTIR